MKKIRGLYRYEGYKAFQLAASLHELLFPEEVSIDGGTRKMGFIFKALSQSYTDGIEDCLQLDEDKLKKMRRRL